MTKIGFYIMWDKNSLSKEKGNVIGDELLSESLCKYLRRIDGVESAELYAPNYLPNEELDIIIYMQPIEPTIIKAKKKILYVQNGFDNVKDYIDLINKYKYDGHILFSKKLLDLYKESGGSGLFLPFGVDIETFYPREKDEKFSFDTSYVGTDIKGKYRTTEFLLPATKFNMGLFGNWPIQSCDKKTLFKYLLRFNFSRFIKALKEYKKEKKSFPYRFILNKISKGKISQEDVPVLYSSTKVNINFTIQSCVDYDTITLRLFEILACRGFCISDKTDIAQKILKDFVVFTDGGKDLEEKIKYYLEHKEEREKIAQKGYDYVIKNCSIEKRANELWNYLKEVLNENIVS